MNTWKIVYGAGGRPGRSAIRAVAGAAFLVLCVLPASGFAATLAENKAACAKQTAAQAIAACTSVLAARGLSAHDLAAAYLDRGTLAARAGDLDNVVADLTQAILLDPANMRARVDRGRVYEKKGDLERAAADYEAALKLDSSNADIRSAFSRVHSEMKASGHKPSPSDAALSARAMQEVRAGLAADKKGQHDEAIRAFTRALGIDPGLAEAYALRGYVDGDKGAWEAAIADGFASIRLAPTNANYPYLLGFSLLAVKDFDRAIESFRRAAQLAPRNGSYLYMVAQAEEQKGDLQAALNDYRRTLKLKPGDKDTQAAIARLEPQASAGAYRNSLEKIKSVSRQKMTDAYARKDWPAVIEAASAVINLDSHALDAWEMLGDAKRQLGKLDDAVYAYKQAIKVAPRDKGVANKLAAVQAEIHTAKNTPGAVPGGQLASLSAALAKNPEDVRALYDRATLYAQAKRWQDALADYNAVIAVHDRDAPKSPAKWHGLTLSDVYTGRGDALLALRHLDQAEQDFLKALDYEKELKVDWRSSQAYGGLNEANRERVRQSERPLKQLCSGDACGAIDASRDSDRACLSVHNKGPETVDLLIKTDRGSRHVILRKGDSTGGLVGIPFVVVYYDCMRGVVQRIDAKTELCLTPDSALPSHYAGPRGLDDRIADCDRLISGFGSLYRAQGEFNDLAGVYVTRGADYEKKGDLQAAVADYTMANGAGSLSWEGLYRRGMAYLKLGKPQWAAIDFHFAALMEPHNKELAKAAAAHRPAQDPAYLAAVYLPKEAEFYTPEAARRLKLAGGVGDVVRFNPNDIIAWNNLGATDLASGETKKAIEDFRHALSIKPRSLIPPKDYLFQSWEPIIAVPHYNLGVAYEKAGEKEKAAAQYKLAAQFRGERFVRAAWLRTDPEAAKQYATHRPSPAECSGDACGALQVRLEKGAGGESCLFVEVVLVAGLRHGTVVKIDYEKRAKSTGYGLVPSRGVNESITLGSGLGNLPHSACLELAGGSFVAKHVSAKGGDGAAQSPTKKVVVTDAEAAAIRRDPDGYLRAVLPPLMDKHDRKGACEAIAKVLSISPDDKFAQTLRQQAHCP